MAQRTTSPEGSAWPGDPRIYFSAERTLMAWVRTGLGIMAFGFVIARFGVAETLGTGGDGPLPRTPSTYAGVFLTIVGALVTAAGALQYRRFVRTLGPTELPLGRASPLAPALAWIMVATGAFLAFLLFL